MYVYKTENKQKLLENINEISSNLMMYFRVSKHDAHTSKPNCF